CWSGCCGTRLAVRAALPLPHRRGDMTRAVSAFLVVLTLVASALVAQWRLHEPAHPPHVEPPVAAVIGPTPLAAVGGDIPMGVIDAAEAAYAAAIAEAIYARMIEEAIYGALINEA